MRKVLIPLFLASGLLTIIMLVMLFTGVIDFKNGNIEALINGNRFYIVKKYDKALDAYKDGLTKNTEDAKLNQNSGLAEYQLNNYDEALKYYAKTSDKVEKYLKSGNSNLKMGDKGSEPNEKIKFYQQALQTYKQGIIKFPQNVDLKYNYEYVKKKIDELQDKNSQNQQDSDKNRDNKEKQQNQQNKENQESQQNQKDQGSKDNQEKQKSQGNQDKEQNQNKETKEANGQDNKQNNQDENSKDSKGSDSKNQQSIQPQQDNGKNDGKDKEALMQAQTVLEMLEQQEKESLKNNQEVKNNGKEAEHDW
jgi:Ca-activated chloride channel family protein